MIGRGRTLPAALIGTVFRPVLADDLPECGRIWRHSINDYLRQLGQPEIPDELAGIGRLHAHTRSTDPERFIVAARPGGDGERIVGFGSAVVRGVPGVGGGPLWYLSMLFVRPEAQGEGLGRTILERLLPEPSFEGSLAVAVDSLQPISTGLYGRYGMVPRSPILDLHRNDRATRSLPQPAVGDRPGTVRDDR